MSRRTAFFFLLVLAACSLAVGQSAPVVVTPGNSLDTHAPKPDAQPQQPVYVPKLKPADLDNRPNLNEGTKMQLIRVMDAEFVHVRKYFPIGDKSMVIGADGAVRPGDAQLFRMAATVGAAAKFGDLVQITHIAFREKTIYLEINGGLKKKQKS